MEPAYPSPESVPKRTITLPTPLSSLHQIEVTSHCNLRCKYCTSPTLGRPKVHMDLPTYARALEHAAHYVNAGTQEQLNLAGIGESTMHPDFVQYMHLARRAVGSTQIVFATNGVSFTEEHAKAMQDLNIVCWVSLHRPEKAGPAADIARKHGVLAGISVDPAINAMDWAGQVDVKHIGIRQSYTPACMWIREQKAMVMADGRVTACCYDSTGGGVIGHVTDAVGSLKTKPWSLCRTCNQEVAVEGYDQRAQVTP